MVFSLWYPALKTWLMPPGCNILPALIGLAIYRLYPFFSKVLFLVSIFSLWIMSTPIFAYNLIETLQNEYPPLHLKKINKQDKASAIVVLGAGSAISVENGNKTTVSSTELSRLRYAAFLHKQTQFPIIVSGGQSMGASDSEANLMIKALRENFGIQSAIKENKGRNTMEESLYMVPVLKEHQLDTVYLVTNAWHMPRSMYAFKKQGIRVIAAPMGFYVYDHRYSLLSYLPNINALHAMSLCMHEYIGIIWYRWRHQ